MLDRLRLHHGRLRPQSVYLGVCDAYSRFEQDWDSYLVFGEETFKRISDPLGRREVGMLFGSCLFNLNEAAFAAHYDEFVGIWFESVVARRLTQQHTFTNQLLNALSADDALFTSITVGKQPDSDLFSFTPDSFVKSRAGLFDGAYLQAHEAQLSL